MDARATDEIFLFEGFRLDLQTGGLLRADENGVLVPVAVGSRALDLLVLLLRRRGELVSKDEIMTAVWPGMIVEDSNLPTQILGLRRVLDRGRTNGSCIQTVSGRGYRFAATVTRCGTDRLPEVSGNGEDRGAGAPPVLRLPNSARSRWGPSHKIAVLFGVLAVAGSLAAWIWDHRWSGSVDTRPRFSMVMLPFSNLGPDPGQEQFVDAINSDLTTALARIGHSFVVSRNTAFTYRNKSLDTKQIGGELGVRYVLEGSVHRSGNKVRVDAQLIDAETDVLLWAQQFDGDVGDLFALEDDITRRIAIALGIELIDREAARPTRYPDAFDYILRGAAVMSAPKTRKTYAEAISLFDRALALDPRAVEAQSFLAIHLAGRVGADVTDTAAADTARGEALAGQAVAAAPRSSLAHMAQAMVLRAQHRFEEAIRAYDAVLTLNRDFVPAYANIAYAKLSAGSTEDAIPLLEEAIRLSPHNSDVGSWYGAIGRAHLMEARVDQAVFWLERALRANPEVGPQPHAWLASAYALNGEGEHAAAELAEAWRLSGDDRYSSVSRLKAVITREPKARALLEPTYLAGLRKAGMPED
jgi:TolB-like protein/DNA-binding winged helix-turn-helix (wHTH) protein/cytochrome c-type biogenesis protein CcmH/NrfG